jgi:hypothetical protein
MDELNNTRDKERRIKLLLTFASLKCELVPIETFLFDISRWDFSKFGDGKIYLSVRECLDRLNGATPSNARDALIAETAIVNGYTLLTAARTCTPLLNSIEVNLYYLGDPQIESP